MGVPPERNTLLEPQFMFKIYHMPLLRKIHQSQEYIINSLTRSTALYRVSLYPAVPHFTAFTFTRSTALPYLFCFMSRKTRCSWRIEYVFISLESEKFTLYTGMKKVRISFL